METFSITAGCEGVLSSIGALTSKITDFSRAVRDARDDLRHASSEALSLQFTIAFINQDVDQLHVHHALNLQLESVLRRCDGILHQMMALLSRLQPERHRTDFSWELRGKGDMEKLTVSLEAHKQTLEVILSVINLSQTAQDSRTTKEAHEVAQSIQATSDKILAEISHVSAKVDNFSQVAPNETQVLRSSLACSSQITQEIAQSSRQPPPIPAHPPPPIPAHPPRAQTASSKSPTESIRSEKELAPQHASPPDSAGTAWPQTATSKSPTELFQSEKELAFRRAPPRDRASIVSAQTATSKSPTESLRSEKELALPRASPRDRASMVSAQSAISESPTQSFNSEKELALQHASPRDRAGMAWARLSEYQRNDMNTGLLRLFFEEGDMGSQKTAAEVSIDKVRWYLDGGADPNACGPKLEAVCVRCDDVDRMVVSDSTVLTLATLLDDWEIVNLLLDRGATVKTCCGNMGTPLHAAAMRGNSLFLDLFLKNGAHINAVAGWFGTALQAAVANNHIEAVELLLMRGAHLDVLGGAYGTPLQAAIANGHLAPLQLLLERGANVNVTGGMFGTALQAAALKDDVRVLDLLALHGADVNAGAGDYPPPLIIAASNLCCTDSLRVLLNRGADANVRGGEAGCALQSAVCNQGDKAMEKARMLIEAGANVDTLGGGYGNPLFAAISLGRQDVALLLLRAGVNLNVRTEGLPPCFVERLGKLSDHFAEADALLAACAIRDDQALSDKMVRFVLGRDFGSDEYWQNQQWCAAAKISNSLFVITAYATSRKQYESADAHIWKKLKKPFSKNKSDR